MQGFPDGWTLPEGYDVNDEDTDTLRYTAVGNAVSVPVVEWVAKKISVELKKDDMEFSEEAAKSYVPEFAKASWSKDILVTDFTDASKTYKWPKAGLAWENKTIGGNVAPTPANPIESSLTTVVEREKAGRKYYLTPNAAEGILRRVDNQGRKLFAPLRTALEIEKAKK